MKKAIRLVCELVMAAAFILAVCTVGASDAENIAHGQFVTQVMICMAAMVLGYVGLKITE